MSKKLKGLMGIFIESNELSKDFKKLCKKHKMITVPMMFETTDLALLDLIEKINSLPVPQKLKELRNWYYQVKDILKEIEKEVKM